MTGQSWLDIYSAKIREKGGLANLILRKAQRSQGMLVRRVVREFPAGSRILDLGTGIGALAILLAKEQFQTTAIDSDPDMVQFARDGAEHFNVEVNVVLMDAFLVDERFPIDTFDCIVSHGFLEHFDDESMKRLIQKQLVLAPRVVFAVPTSNMSARYTQHGHGDERYLSTGRWTTLLNLSSVSMALASRKHAYVFCRNGFAETKSVPASVRG